MVGPRYRSIALLLGLAATGPALAQFVEGQAVASRKAGDYTALRQRPLFSPDRAAPIPFAAPAEIAVVAPPEPEPPPPAASAPDWKLVGLVRSSRVNSAMFKADGAEAAFSLRMGESRDGWTLTEVGRFEVTIDSGDGRASVSFPTMQ